jgi:hypothetical protein
MQNQKELWRPVSWFSAVDGLSSPVRLVVLLDHGKTLGMSGMSRCDMSRLDLHMLAPYYAPGGQLLREPTAAAAWLSPTCRLRSHEDSPHALDGPKALGRTAANPVRGVVVIQLHRG